MAIQKRLGAGLGALVLVYLASVFVRVDWFWLRGMFTTWSDMDRVFFLIMSLCIAVIGNCALEIYELNK